jgi:hypothetical protein
MRSLIAVVLALVMFAAPCLAGDRSETVYDYVKPTFDPAVPGPVFDEDGRIILYDNGPFETRPGFSTLQNTSLGMGTYGFGYQFYYGNMLADEFVIPVGETWEINQITFFGYQTGSETNPSTFIGHYVTIWDGPPDLPGSSIVWGDMSVNVLTSSVWSGVYRELESAAGATNRPIMANTCAIGTTLTAGTYWLVWQADGTLSSGPWAPPITILGVIGTGNALQYTTSGGVWAPALDIEQQGFPFLIEGVFPSPVEESTWAAVKAMFR